MYIFFIKRNNAKSINTVVNFFQLLLKNDTAALNILLTQQRPIDGNENQN